MSWGTPTNIGSSSASGVHSITVTGLNASVGDIVFLTCGIRSHANGDTIIVTDSAGNTYTIITKYVTASTFGAFSAYAVVTSALVSGSITITDTSTVGNTFTNVVPSVWKVSGGATVSSEDVSVQVSIAATSGSPSLTSGTPTQAGDIFFYTIAETGAWSSYTEDASWTTLDNQSSSAPISGNRLISGYLINAGTSTKVHNPTIAGSSGFSHIIFALKIAGSTISVRQLSALGVG